MGYSNFYARFYAICQRTGEALLSIWRFRPSRWYFLFILLFQVLAWLQAWFIAHNLTGELAVLRHNVNFGITLIGPPERVLIYPLFGLAIFFLNLVIAVIARNHKDWRIFVQLLLGTAVFFGLLLSLVLLSIYLINFR